jgi:hypothetical protein
MTDEERGGKVLRFEKPTVPHLRGPARCLGCGYRWEAVAPEGTITSLECPDCARFHGVFEGVTEPEHGTRFVCDCGCDLYYILPSGCQCLMCGVIAKGF